MKKQISYLILLTILLVILTKSSYSQENTDSIYGLDPTLYNGQYNHNYLSKDIKGHPFLYDTEFSTGTVTINNKTYKSVDLNYDIFNQEILLKYKNTFGSVRIIILSKAWIKKFTINDNSFELISKSGNENEIYHVIGIDSIQILYRWSKTLNLSGGAGKKNYSFSKPKKEMYIYIDGQFLKFKNNRSFIKNTEAQNQLLIKKYLKNNKINIKKTTNKVILNLITYYNNLEN